VLPFLDGRDQGSDQGPEALANVAIQRMVGRKRDNSKLTALLLVLEEKLAS
jgi:hypothetical protein